MLLEVVDVVVLVLALPVMLAAIVLLVRGMAQPEKEAANRLFKWYGALIYTFVVLVMANNLLRRFLEG